MRTHSSPSRSRGRLLLTVVVPLLLALALALPGCATRRQVSEIVTQSNAALLGAQFDLPAATDPVGTPAWQRESDRIEAFIAAHPDQNAITAPLRVRQAMLLLSYRQISLNRTAPEVARMLDALSIHIVPMLNPDGAERYHRRNAQSIDVNRDALLAQTPEGRALKALRDRLKPSVAFNLHNQNWRTSVGRPPRPASSRCWPWRTTTCAPRARDAV